jgi:ubiquinone/menaquinone biosynthesis C-methylase UbiE
MILNGYNDEEKTRTPTLLCPKCKHDLKIQSQGFICPICQEIFSKQGGIISFFNSNFDPDSFASLEAKAHDDSAEISHEFMGSNLYYNEKLHSFIYQQIAAFLAPEQRILEIGSGVGRDVVVLAQRNYRNLHASDVSLNSIIRAKQLAEQKGVADYISFYHLDGSRLPFENAEFDAIIMIATLHHFSSTDAALNEIKRCCKTGGYIMAFIEPNYLYYRYIRPIAKIIEKIFSPFHRNRKTARSIAEDTATGFSIPIFCGLAQKTGLEVVAIQSHWVLTGFVYLLQQFCFRILKMRCRFLLNSIARVTCFIDNCLIRQKTPFCWHYSVIYRVK